ncbi:MAG: CsgG/HfaB family protein [Treponema sp.]|nr:CsgG/HfaB family protein [Treponema sp.]
MKKVKKFLMLGLILLAYCFLGSCASMARADGMNQLTTQTQGTYKQLTANERANANILGEITIKVHKAAPNLIALPSFSLEEAYEALLNEAHTQHSGNVDVRNVTIKVDRYYEWTHEADFTAKGTVISLSGTAASGIEGALARAADETLKNVPKRSKIAIVYITAQDRSTTEYIVGELEYILVNQSYFITDRSQLDRLRREQNFQMSGEVDDATAVSIGKFAGADIIVTGRVDGEGNLRRLRLRALNTQTAQVVGVASERL